MRDRSTMTAPMAELPRFTLPAGLARLAAGLPQLPPTIGLVTALNLALDRVLPRERLEPLVGRSILIRVTDAGLSLSFTLTPRGFRPAARGARHDLRISASARDFIALALRREDPDALFFDRRLSMEGDTDLGLVVKNTLDAIDLSRVEPVIAKVLGWAESARAALSFPPRPAATAPRDPGADRR